MPEDQPDFILAPVTRVVELLTGENATYIENRGYLLAGLNIVINKSCSGFNFMCITFGLICFVISGYPPRRKHSLYLLLLPTLICAYLFTLAVNTSRILLAVQINFRVQQWGFPIPDWLHLAEGVFVYLFFLILIYIITNSLFTKIISHEKPA